MLKKLFKQFLGAITFYTCLPIPYPWQPEFQGIARVAPLIGLGIGGLLGLTDWGLAELGLPILTRSAIAVSLWLFLTGGLHLDGAMDTADGLAVMQPERRLEVMSDSRTGAFGAIAAVVVILLKTVAFSEIERDRTWLLMLAAGWGRWGQLVAIARYPYLKPTGKGAFHKESIKSRWEAVPTLLILVALSVWVHPVSLIGGAIAFLTGIWFNRKLGGQTGDTYGAIVEWTEALFLCLMTAL